LKQTGLSLERIIAEECQTGKIMVAGLQGGSRRREVSSIRAKIARRSLDELGVTMAEIARQNSWDKKDFFKKGVIADAVVVKAPYTYKTEKETLNGVWEERWTVRYQKEDFPVTVMFIPDGKGGAKTVVISEKTSKKKEI
jgi:hypothetical protein